MPFNSLSYFLFLPVVYLVFILVQDRMRWLVLLLASFFFYAQLNAPYLLGILMLVSVITYCVGILSMQTKSAMIKKTLFWGGVAANLLILGIMKYPNKFMLAFANNNPGQPSHVLLVIGISYYVFQAISYLIDVYLEVIIPEKHLGYFVLSLAFFPKLLQGPIERSGNLLPQLKANYKFNRENVRSGILLFAWGLLKKIAIADRLGLYADLVFNHVHEFKGLSLVLATYAYAFQIYMDFSGYTDMALGSARLFNIQLTQNFNSPYTARSVADFWRRWHISFSSWILDYIFKPLQMQWRNWKNWGTALALIVTFLVSGIWHGAKWGFLIWGLLHGLYLACSVFYKPYQKKIHAALKLENSWFLKVWQVFWTFNLVSFAWIFFRANSVKEAVYVISNIFHVTRDFVSDFLLSQGKTELFLTYMFLMLLYFKNKIHKPFFDWPVWIRSVFYILIYLYVTIFIVKGGHEFIYSGF